MIRRLVPVVAVALLGACSQNSANTNAAPEPGAPSTTRNADGGRRDGADGGRRGPGGPGGQREEMALRGITLSTDQQQRIDSIRASYRTRMEEARQAANGDRAAMRERMQPLMERQQADIRAVLTADQQAQFDRNVAEMRERMQQGGRRPNG